MAIHVFPEEAIHKGTEQLRIKSILETTVKLPIIETSRPDGRIQKQTSLKETTLILEETATTNSKAIAKLLEKKLLDLKPKGLSNSGVPETLEELCNMSLRCESVIDDYLEEQNLSISEAEMDLFTLMSTISESVKRLEKLNTLGKNKEMNSKILSVSFQQDVFKTLYKFYNSNGFGSFEHLITAILELSEMYLNGKAKGAENRSLVSARGYMDGIRGMLTTAMLLRSLGLKVYLPHPEDDVINGSDLVTIIDGQKVAISIKAKLGQLSADDRDPLNSTLSYVTHSNFNDAKYLFLEIPNIYNDTSIRASEFYDNENFVLGVPSGLAEHWFKKEIDLVKQQLKKR